MRTTFNTYRTLGKYVEHMDAEAKTRGENVFGLESAKLYNS